MIKIDNIEYDDYELNLDYKYDFIYDEDSVEFAGWWPMRTVKIRHSDTKKISISPVFIIKTKMGSKLYAYLDYKKNLIYDAMTGRIGFKKDYVFDMKFDDKFESTDSGEVQSHNSFIESSAINDDGTVTFSIVCDFVNSDGGCYDFINYIGKFEIPKSVNNNYIEYLKKHAHKRF